MTPERQLYDVYVEHVDPATYQGHDSLWCLNGQTAAALGCDFEETGAVWFLSYHFGVSSSSVRRIDLLAARPQYKNDLPAALAMARHVLGLER